MKMRMLVCSVAALGILLACSVGLAENKVRTKGQRKKISQEQKEFQEKLKAMSPQERRITLAKKAFEVAMAPWREVRKIALAEKATKTVAAIDKIIAAKEGQFKKKLAGAAKRKEAGAKKPKTQDKSKGKGKAKDKAAAPKKQ